MNGSLIQILNILIFINIIKKIIFTIYAVIILAIMSMLLHYKKEL